MINLVVRRRKPHFREDWQEVKNRLRTARLLRSFKSPVKRYVKFGFGGAHTESNQRLMYASA